MVGTNTQGGVPGRSLGTKAKPPLLGTLRRTGGRRNLQSLFEEALLQTGQGEDTIKGAGKKKRVKSRRLKGPVPARRDNNIKEAIGSEETCDNRDRAGVKVLKSDSCKKGVLRKPRDTTSGVSCTRPKIWGRRPGTSKDRPVLGSACEGKVD